METAILPIPGLLVADPAVAESKLAEIQAQGVDNLHVLLDFDRTVTVPKSGEDDATSWQVLQRHLPEEGQARYDEFYRHYRQLELARKMTDEDSRTWCGSILDLFVEYAVDLNKIESDFLNVVDIRPGVREVFDTCNRLEVPIVILSAGVKDVIDVLLAKSGLTPSLTLATELVTDKNGLITGWNRDTLIHIRNKREAGHRRMEPIRQHRPNCLVVGDGIDDADMASGDAGIFRTRLIDPRPDEKKSPEMIRNETFEKFDALTETRTLYPLVTLLGKLAVPLPSATVRPLAP